VNKKLPLTWLDIGVTLLLVVTVGYLSYRTTVVLHYRWNWSVIPLYLFRYDPEEGQWVTNLLMEGFLTTIRLSVWTTALALPLGVVMALLRISGSLFRRMAGRTYVELIRNIPPLVLIFIFYFFISDQIMTALRVDTWALSRSEGAQSLIAFLFAPPGRFSAFLSALLTMVIYEGAYMTEIIRGGIQSIDRGQWEAAAASGLTRRQQMRFVIFPQAIPRIIPPLAGQLISTIKDSAIVSVISSQELTFQGMELMAATYLTFEIWITVTVLYFILTFCCSLIMRYLEVTMQKRGYSATE